MDTYYIVCIIISSIICIPVTIYFTKKFIDREFNKIFEVED